MTKSLNWNDGLEEEIAYLAKHDPKGLNVALNHLPPDESCRSWIKFCVEMAQRREQAEIEQDI